MRVGVALRLAGLWLVLICGAQAVAEPTASMVRTGNHTDYGRVVFDLSSGATAWAEQVGPRVLVHLNPQANLRFGKAPRNVLTMTRAEDGAELTLAPGTRMRLSRLGGRLVIDALDPPPIRPETGPSAANRILHNVSPDGITRARKALVLAASARSPPPIVVASPVAVADAPRPEVAAMPVIGSLALAARPASSDEAEVASLEQTIILPFAATTGAAAFRRGNAGFVVFDERRPIDMAQLHDSRDFANAAITLLPEATQLRVPLPPQMRLVLTRAKAGWVLAIRSDDKRNAGSRPIDIAAAQGRLTIDADQPGHVISVPDPLTGSLVLVGTQLVHGQAVAARHVAPEFGLLETWQGVAVLPLADALRLTPTVSGFVLALDPPRPLAISVAMPQTAAETAAQGFSRRFDFPNLATEQLWRRLQSAIAEAAAAPTQSRGRKRIFAAEAMIALGLGVEAQALLTLAASDDATLADDPIRIGLSAIAALLVGRLKEASGINDPRLDGSDDVTLWRAIGLALREEGSPSAAVHLAPLYPLVLAYPAPLRTAMLPIIAETMALGGEVDAATILVKTNLNEAGLDFARAILAARDPTQAPAALEKLDRLAAAGDRLIRLRAATRAVEVRLAAHMITPVQAADAMNRQIYAWRGDDRELATRLRTAELYGESHSWRPALRLLRETAELWPSASTTVQPRLLATFMQALATDTAAPLPPLELVALAEENADLIPTGSAGQALSLRLADRLIALDLPQRAVPLLTRILEQTEQVDTRSEVGARLAEMQMQMGKPDAALTTLNNTLGVGSLPPDLLEQRRLIYAQAASGVGQRDQAVTTLEALGTLKAVRLQAHLQETAKNWPGALRALEHLTAMSVPDGGPLDETAAQILLRLASAAVQVEAVDVLDRLRAHDLPRLPGGRAADLLRIITSGPVHKVGDLPRAAEEARSLAHAINGAGI